MVKNVGFRSCGYGAQDPKEGRWRRKGGGRREEGWVWKEGRGVKWAGISQALRTRDRDVSRERDKKPLSRAGTVGWALSPTTFFHAGVEGSLHANRQHIGPDRMDFIVARNCGHRLKSPSIIPHNRPIRQAPLWIASQWFCARSFCRTTPTISTRKRLIYTRSRSETRLK